MEFKTIIYIVIGIIAYSAIVDYEGFRADPKDQIINALKELPGKAIDIAKGETQEEDDGAIETVTNEEGEIVYVNYGKPERTGEFSCVTDGDCNHNLEICENKCRCDVSTGECYRGEIQYD